MYRYGYYAGYDLLDFLFCYLMIDVTITHWLAQSIILDKDLYGLGFASLPTLRAMQRLDRVLSVRKAAF
jgi:hypothetical protein